MSILKTESIASRPISDVYSPRVFSVLRGLKSTRTIACTPCTGSISPLRSILSSSSSKRERERERERKRASVSSQKERTMFNSFWIIHKEREREREERTQHASTAGFRHLRARFFPRFRRFLPVSASHEVVVVVVVVQKKRERKREQRPFEKSGITSMRSFLIISVEFSPFC